MPKVFSLDRINSIESFHAKFTNQTFTLSRLSDQEMERHFKVCDNYIRNYNKFI